MFEQEIYKCFAFRQTSIHYEVELVHGSLDRSYPKLFEMAQQVLDIEQVRENDRLAKGATIEKGCSMAFDEQEVTKFCPGDCKACFSLDDATGRIAHQLTQMYLPTC